MLYSFALADCILWWPRSDSNGHVPFGTTDFKSGASTNSATGPFGCHQILRAGPMCKWRAQTRSGRRHFPERTQVRYAANPEQPRYP